MLCRKGIRHMLQCGGRLEELFTILLAQVFNLLDQVLELFEIVFFITII